MARSVLKSKDSFELLFSAVNTVTIVVAVSWMSLCLKNIE